MNRRVGVATPVAIPAPVLGLDRHPDAVYWIETCIGIAFEHVSALPLLAGHYGDQQLVVADVHAEWANKADSHKAPPSQYDSAAARATYDQWARVRAMCDHLCKKAIHVLGDPVELGFEEEPAVRALRERLVAMPRPDSPLGGNDAWTHRGECATLRATQLHHDAEVAAGRPAPVQVLTTNDGKAGRLATTLGVASRTSAEILREMVRCPPLALPATDAWDMHTAMEQVAALPATADRPDGPHWFI